MDTKPGYQSTNELLMFYKLCKNTEYSVPTLIERYRNAVLINRNKVFHIIFYMMDSKGMQRDDVFLNLLDEFVHTKQLKLFFKIKIVDALIKLGKWNLIVKILEKEPNAKLRMFIFEQIRKALSEGNIRCATFMPRNGVVANRIRGFLGKDNQAGMNPADWRKLLVSLCKNQMPTMMSMNRWSEIDYSKLPTSVIVTYYNAIRRHDKERFREYLKSVPVRETTIKKILKRDSLIKLGKRSVKIPSLREILNSHKYFKWGGKPNTNNRGQTKCSAQSAK